MCNKLYLSPTIGAFCDLLDGDSVAIYEDMGTTVIDALHIQFIKSFKTWNPIDEFQILRYRIFHTI